MAKKSRPKYTSKGGLGGRMVSGSEHDAATKIIIKQQAFLKGKKCYFTIDNPNTAQTNKRKIRVAASELYGDYRKFNERHILERL